MVDSIEKFILKQQGLPVGKGNKSKRHHSKGSKKGAENHTRCVVTVDERPPHGNRWIDSRLVNSGLELNLEEPGAKPRMPRASAHALSDVRRTLMPASVALSVDSSTPDSVAKTVVDHLARVGLPPQANEEINGLSGAIFCTRGDHSQSKGFDARVSLTQSGCTVLTLLLRSEDCRLRSSSKASTGRD